MVDLFAKLFIIVVAALFVCFAIYCWSGFIKYLKSKKDIKNKEDAE